MWLITHLPPPHTHTCTLLHFFILLLEKKEEKEEQELEKEHESQGGGAGLGGIYSCCYPLYLNNCTSGFIGFREVLCVSVGAALGM